MGILKQTLTLYRDTVTDQSDDGIRNRWPDVVHALTSTARYFPLKSSASESFRPSDIVGGIVPKRAASVGAISTTSARVV